MIRFLRIQSAVLCVILITIVLPVTVRAEDAVYLTQAGNRTCTLCSATMMIRNCLYVNSDDRWTQVTEQSVGSTAWTSAGLSWGWTYTFEDSFFTVAQQGYNGITPDQLRQLLDAHPEGIVLYCGGASPHAVLLTDYVADTFYCADPAFGYGGERIPLERSLLGSRHGSQINILARVSACWYIAAHNVEDPGYLGQCEEYPSHCIIRVRWDGHAMTLPCTTDVCEESESVMVIRSGETYTATALYVNADGQCWYQVDTACYISAADADYVGDISTGITLSGWHLPQTVFSTDVVSLTGKVESAYLSLTEVSASVCKGYESIGTPMTGGSGQAEGKEYSLTASCVDSQTCFSQLDPGVYTCTLRADYIGFHALDAYRFTSRQGTVILKQECFTVMRPEQRYITIRFSSPGGNTPVKCVSVASGLPLQHLPEPEREGYLFRGWYTAPEGGERITETSVLREDRQLWAQWSCGHRYTDWSEPTAEGQREAVCLTCGEIKIQIIALEPEEFAFSHLLLGDKSKERFAELRP